MVLERARLGGASIDVERRPSEVPAETIPATLTDGRTDLTSTDSFVPVVGPARPETAPRPAVGHPLFVCRDIPTGTPSEMEAISAEDFDTFFECRMTEIDGHIAAGRLTEASQLIRETNASWRAFNAAHREIPQRDRSAYLGSLYLARSRIEATYGESRTLWRTYYEARGYDLTGDHARARLRYRAVMAMPVPSPATSEIRDIAHTSSERRRALELDALDRLTATAGSILQQRDQRLIFDRIYGFAENDINQQFLGSLRTLIVSGRADTVDEAVEALRGDHLRAHSEFLADPRITSDWRVRVWPELTHARLEGGTLETFGVVAPPTMTVTVGPEGGTIVVPGATYYFPPSDREVTVRMAHARVLDVRRGDELLTDRHGFYRDPSLSDERIPAEILSLGGTRRREYAPSSATARIHPNTFDLMFDREGGYQTGGLFHFDESLRPMLEMEMQDGLESLTDESTRGEYLIGIAERMRSRDGSYGVSAACLEEVFAAQFERAASYVVEHRSDEVDELRSDSENEDEFTAGLMTLVSEQMETWSESGELASADPVAARAWSIYNDMLDPANEYFNMMDESQDAMVDEAIITGITFIPTMGLGSVAAEGVEGARAVRLVAAAASVGSRRLLLRFGPRLASLGARAAYGLVVGGTATTARVAVEAPVMTLGSSGLTGHPMDLETGVDGSLHTAGHLMIYHAAGAVLPRPLRFAAESYLGRDLGEWASGSAARRMGLRLYFNGGSLTTMTGVATGLSYTDGADDRLFADRLTGEAARMGYMTFLGGLAGEGGRGTSAAGPTFTSDLMTLTRDALGEGVRYLPIPGMGMGGIGFVSGVRPRSGGVPAPVLGAEFRGMPASYRSRPVRVEGGAVVPLEAAPTARLVERLDTDFASEGSTAGVFRAEMTVDGEPREVAVKVFRNPQPHPVEGTVDWEGTVAYAERELANLETLADLGLGPRPHGMVSVDGNIAIAMDRVAGRAIDEMTPSEVRRFVTEGTYRQLGEMWQRLVDAGYEISDFQFAVLTRAQVVDGRPMRAGDVVFWDAGGLRPISEFRAEAESAGLPYAPRTAAEIVAAARETAETMLEGEPASVEDRPTMPPPPDMPRLEPRPAVMADGPIARTLPRSATAVGLAMRHANAYLADATGFRFAVETSLRNPGEAGGSPSEVDVWVVGPEAEATFLETLRNASSSVTVEDMGGGEYRVHDADRGDCVVTIRHGLELSIEQQTHLGEWLREVPPSERDGIALTRYSHPRLESLVDHLIGRGWNQAQIEGLFVSRGFTAEETTAIIGPRISSAAREGRSGTGTH